MAGLYGTNPNELVFLNPLTGKRFNPSSFCCWFKRYLKQETGVSLPPKRLRYGFFTQRCTLGLEGSTHLHLISYRHIFASERLSPETVPGPSNQGAAQVRVSPWLYAL